MLNTTAQQVFLRTYFFYYRKTIDGIKGSGTIAAIKAYQSGQSLVADGIWGVKTDACSRSNARAVQSQLSACGYPCTADGIIGAKTINALTNFQKAHGLSTDGIMGRQTYNALFGGSSSSSGGSLPSAHFKKSEFRCGCGGRYCDGYNGREVNPQLVEILEAIRTQIGKPVIITSGIRCDRYNNSLRGSVPNSVHRLGGAADIYIAGVTTNEAGRRRVSAIAKSHGAAYVYWGTSNMGNAVHINI